MRKEMMRNILFVILIVLSNIGAFAQNFKISHQQAMADLDSLILALKEIHPDLFFVRNENDFNDSLQKIKEALPVDSMTSIDFYKNVQPLTTMLEDGHTQLYFPTEEIKQENNVVFPIHLNVDLNDSTLTTTNNFEIPAMTIKAGTQVLSINNHSYKEMVIQMLKYCGGERPFFRLSKIERDFVHFLYMLYPANQFTVKFSDSETDFECTLNAIPYSDFLKKNVKEIENLQSPYSFKILNDSIGLMQFNAFSGIDNFKIFADSMFTVVKKKEVKNLIIDMRANGGGDSRIGDELFQYISRVPFQQFSRTVTRYSPLQKKLTINNFGSDYSSFPNGIVVNDTIQPIALRTNPNRFKGKVFLLISHMTFSSAGSFSWTFKKNNMGQIFGEESGGMSVCFGNVVIYKLPNTHINATISYARMYEYDANDQNIHGTIPDVIVNQDKALEYSIKYIKEER